MDIREVVVMLPRLLLAALLQYVLIPVTTLAAETSAGPATTLRIITEPSGRGRLKDKHGNVYGMSTELVMAIQQQLGNNSKIEVMPWARAYATALSSNNVAIYDTIRTADREDKFKWVGPIKIYSVDIHARVGTVGKNVSLTALLQQHVICETRNTSIVSELLALGFEIDKNLILSRQVDDCYNMLKIGRADLIVMHSDVTPKRQAELRQTGLELEAVYPLKKIDMYIAFSSQVDDTLIKQWQCALNKLVLEGEFRRLYEDEYPKAMLSEIETRAAISQQQMHCPG